MSKPAATGVPRGRVACCPGVKAAPAAERAKAEPGEGFASVHGFAAHRPPPVTLIQHLPTRRHFVTVPLWAHITPPTPQTPQPIVPPPPPPGPDVVPPDIDDPVPGETPVPPVHEPPGVPAPMALRRRPH